MLGDVRGRRGCFPGVPPSPTKRQEATLLLGRGTPAVPEEVQPATGSARSGLGRPLLCAPARAATPRPHTGTLQTL